MNDITCRGETRTSNAVWHLGLNIGYLDKQKFGRSFSCQLNEMDNLAANCTTELCKQHIPRHHCLTEQCSSVGQTCENSFRFQPRFGAKVCWSLPWSRSSPRPSWLLSYQEGKSNCGDKTVVKSSYLHDKNSYTGRTAILYWNSPRFLNKAMMSYRDSVHIS